MHFKNSVSLKNVQKLTIDIFLHNTKKICYLVAVFERELEKILFFWKYVEKNCVFRK